METIKKTHLLLLAALLLIFTEGCKKSNAIQGSIYTPTEADVTANATLEELQQGRALYINNCGSCHSLYSPDSYSSSQWTSIMAGMAPQTNMTASEIQLVTKYVTRGK